MVPVNSLSPGSASKIVPCSWSTQTVVCIIIPAYFAAFNWMPACLLLLPMVGVSLRVWLGFLGLIIVMCLIVGLAPNVMNACLAEDQKRLSKPAPTIQEYHLEHQFEREKLTNSYFSKRYIIPTAVLESASSKPVIIVITPHNVVPWGNTGALSKLFGDRATVWAAAPVLFNIPFVSAVYSRPIVNNAVRQLRPLLKKYGAFPASKTGILQALAEVLSLPQSKTSNRNGLSGQ